MVNSCPAGLFVTIFLSFEGLQVASPTGHWSYGPLVPRAIGPTGHWSYGPLDLRAISPTAGNDLTGHGWVDLMLF